MDLPVADCDLTAAFQDFDGAVRGGFFGFKTTSVIAQLPLYFAYKVGIGASKYLWVSSLPALSFLRLQSLAPLLKRNAFGLALAPLIEPIQSAFGFKAALFRVLCNSRRGAELLAEFLELLRKIRQGL